MSNNSEKLRFIADQIEQGIEEVGRGEGMNIKAFTTFKKDTVRLPDHVMLFQAFSMFAAGKFKPTTCKVLLKLLSISAYENFISIDIKTISEEIGMSIASVNRSLKELQECNVIGVFKHTQDRRRNDYFINPTASWRGNGMNRNKMIQKLKNDQYQLEFPTE